MSLNRGIPAWRKATAGFIGTALTAGALVVVGATAPAHAAPSELKGGSLSWGLSGYLNTAAMGSLSPLGSAYVAPASFDPASKLSTFEVEAADISSTGAELTFDGASLNFASTGVRWLKLDDLAVSVDADGNGELSAAVSYGAGTGSYPTSSYDPDTAATYRGPQRLTLVELQGNTADQVSITDAAANWSDLQGLWSDEFREFLSGDTDAEPPIPGLSYVSQIVNGDPNLAPQPLNIAVDFVVPTVTAKVVRADADYIDLSIAGSDFDLSKNAQRAPDGIYVGVAPTGTDIFAIESGGQTDGMAKFVASDHVPASAFTDGSFTKALAVDVAKLTRGGSYSVFTWSAHGNPETGDQLYTATPIAIDWSALKPTPSTPVKTKTKKPKTNVKKKQVVIKAKVNAAGKATAKGKVRFVVKKGKKTIFKKKVKVNKKGVAKLKLKKKKLRKLLKGKRIQGKYQVRAKFLGNKQFAAAKVSKSRFRIK